MGDVSFVDTDFRPDYRFLDVEGGRLAWWEQGTSERSMGENAIVWVHGLPLDSRSWEPQRRHFAPLCRNVFVDLRGYGRSSKLPAGTADVTALYCADLAALFDAAALRRAMLVGFASAGHVALRFAALHPGRVAGLVTINGSPCFRRREDWAWGFSDDGIARFTAMAGEGGIEGLTDAVLDPGLVFKDLSAADGAKLAAWFRSMSLSAGVDTLMGFFTGIANDDDRDLLPRIAARTLLISSTLGEEVQTGVALFCRRRMPDALLAELPDTDHFAFATRPALVNALIEGMWMRGRKSPRLPRNPAQC